ncbi:MAG: dockerin type I repeat-containing protein [Clostridia bacterium]|nr:dockerin type I repeat-containing protein [Clostridia bacterium]
MKKLLSTILILTLILSIPLGTTVSAYTYPTLEEETAHLNDDDGSYYTIHISSEEYPDIYNYPSWVKVNNLLPDVSKYSASVDEALFAQYKEYVYAQHQKVQDISNAFFNENFTSKKDHLIFSAIDRGYIIIYATKAEALKADALENAWVNYHGNNWSQVEWRIKEEGSPYFNIENYTPEPYELVYALHFYEDYEPALISRWDDYYYMYHNLYSHNTEASATPDFVLIFAGETMCSPALSAGEFGDYLLQVSNIYYPYIYGYHIITTKDMKVHTLTEAYNAKLDGIMDVFTEYGLGTLRGDSNFDGKITIRDVTKIQKCLATIENFTDREYASGFHEGGGSDFSERVSDFNCDGVVNIRDATDIQKHLAKVDRDDPDFKDFEAELPDVPVRYANITFEGETYKFLPGDKFRITTELSCSETIGSINLRFDHDSLINVSKKPADDVNAFIAEMCPNLIPSVTLYGWDDYHYDGGYVQVQTHDYNGYNFKENKVLATFEFEVLRHGDGEINLRNLSIAGVYPEQKPLYEYGEEKNGAEVEIFSYLTVLETAVK